MMEKEYINEYLIIRKVPGAPGTEGQKKRLDR